MKEKNTNATIVSEKIIGCIVAHICGIIQLVKKKKKRLIPLRLQGECDQELILALKTHAIS